MYQITNVRFLVLIIGCIFIAFLELYFSFLILAYLITIKKNTIVHGYTKGTNFLMCFSFHFHDNFIFLRKNSNKRFSFFTIWAFQSQTHLWQNCFVCVCVCVCVYVSVCLWKWKSWNNNFCGNKNNFRWLFAEL